MGGVPGRSPSERQRHLRADADPAQPGNHGGKDDHAARLGPGPKQSPEVNELRYVLSTCMTCGCCLEVCPQVAPGTAFLGAAAISQVRLFNSHPTGAMNASERLHGLMGEGGVADCGKAANC